MIPRPRARSLQGLLRLRGEDRGQAAVELALVAPVFVLLIMGLVSFARAWNIRQVLTDAAREGARNAVVASPLVSEESVTATVRDALRLAALDPTAATIQVEGVEGEPGTPTRVAVQYPLELPGLAWALPGDGSLLTLSSAVVMRHE